MRRLVMVWAASLIVIVVVTSSVFLLHESGLRQSARMRESRVAIQQLRQQITVLQAPGANERVSRLQDSLDALQIRLVESLVRQPWPEMISAVNYEMALMPKTLTDHATGDDFVQVLRIDLQMLAQNGIAFLAMLERIDDAIGAWPAETRGCSLQRRADSDLQVRCMIDIYHWQPAFLVNAGAGEGAGVSAGAGAGAGVSAGAGAGAGADADTDTDTDTIGGDDDGRYQGFGRGDRTSGRDHHE